MLPRITDSSGAPADIQNSFGLPLLCPQYHNLYVTRSAKQRQCSFIILYIQLMLWRINSLSNFMIEWIKRWKQSCDWDHEVVDENHSLWELNGIDCFASTLPWKKKTVSQLFWYSFTRPLTLLLVSSSTKHHFEAQTIKPSNF